MTKHSKFIKWHRSLDIATAVLVGGIVVLAVAGSGLALAPLPLICVLMVMKAAVSLTQDYKNYRHGKVVSAEWLFSLIWHIAFVGGACFFIWVTTLLAIAVVSAS